MARVSITINANSYDIACADGEEQHIEKLAGVVAAKVDELVGAIGQAGEARLLAMAGLLMADELADAKRDVEVLSQEAAVEVEPVAPSSTGDDERLAVRLEALAEHIETIAQRVEEA
jgi:cell division protein ZapA